METLQVLPDWPWALTTSTLDSRAACICPILIWAMTEVTPTWISTTYVTNVQPWLTSKQTWSVEEFGSILISPRITVNNKKADHPSLNKMNLKAIMQIILSVDFHYTWKQCTKKTIAQTTDPFLLRNSSKPLKCVSCIKICICLFRTV